MTSHQPDDTALAIEAAQRLADYAIEHGADSNGVQDDLDLIEKPVRRLQQQAASDRALYPLVSAYRGRVAISEARSDRGPTGRRSVYVDDEELTLLLDALDPETRP